MNYLNLQAVGRLTKDVLFFEANGEKKAAAVFTVAVTTGKDAEGKDIASFIDCKINQDMYSKYAAYLKRGKEVMVQGLPAVRTYESNGRTGASQYLYVNFINLGADPQGSATTAPAKLEEAPL